MVKDTTLYDRLEISADSDENQIKKAYNKLSKIWHPDKHVDEVEKEKAALKFKEITEAKEILLDKQKRDTYDQMGMDMFNQQQVDNQPFNPFENMFPGGFHLAACHMVCHMVCHMACHMACDNNNNSKLKISLQRLMLH